MVAQQMQEAQAVNTALAPNRNHQRMLWSAYCVQELGIRSQNMPPKGRPVVVVVGHGGDIGATERAGIIGVVVGHAELVAD
eukprot:5062566-Lingulodinium_polyedra.AAC.1